MALQVYSLKSGGFILEVFNPHIGGPEIKLLIKILEPFKCRLGCITTVISKQINLVFYQKQVQLPSELLKNNTYTTYS